MYIQGNQGVTGKQTGQNIIGGMGECSDLLVTELMPRYYENAYRGVQFVAAAQAAITLGVGLSATSVWTLLNPASSGVNLVLLDFIFAFSAAPAAATVLYLTSPGTAGQAAPTGLTELTKWSGALVGTALNASKGRVLTAATLAAAPIVSRVVASIVATGSIAPPYIKDEVAGAIVIPPGSHVTLQATAAAAGFPSMTWAEIAI